MAKFRIPKNSSLVKSTITAASGLLHAIKTEKKIRQVIMTATATTAVCWVVNVGHLQILLVMLSWVIALICEMFNTALEKALDYASGKEYHPLVRAGKDYASACTFIALFFAIALALFVLIEATWR